MNVGFIGLGKLGLPCALALGQHHDVVGNDVRPVEIPQLPYRGEGGVVDRSSLQLGTVGDVVAHADVIFVAVQTPHRPEYEGITRLPETRVDFDYTNLKAAVRSIALAAFSQHKAPTVVVISTVLPGTMEREIRPLLGACTLVYNPSFIAMGTTIRDYLDPELILLGGDRDRQVERVYREAMIDAPAHHVTVETAELTKVAYNTFIGLKVAFANTIMEVCHKTPNTNCDKVIDGLSLAHRRLMSPAYLRGGMGDGGGCHPRDNIALSWLARKLDLSHDLFDDLMVCREQQADWLVQLMCEHNLPKAILGVGYKADSPLTLGSPALLVAELLRERGHDPALIDPVALGERLVLTGPHVFLVGARHSTHPHFRFPKGSVVIDPWRYIPDRDDVTVIRVGE